MLHLEDVTSLQILEEEQQSDPVQFVVRQIERLATNIANDALALGHLLVEGQKIGFHYALSQECTSMVDWVCNYCHIPMDIIRLSINKYTAYDAVKVYGIEPEMIRHADPIHVQKIQASLRDVDAQVRSVVADLASIPVSQVTNEDISRFPELGERVKPMVAGHILSILEEKPSDLRSSVQESGGPADKPLIVMDGLSFDPLDNHLHAEIDVFLRDSQIETWDRSKSVDILAKFANNPGTQIPLRDIGHILYQMIMDQQQQDQDLEN
jgi:hypothetical protein